MSLAAGSKLGPYEILAPIGAGGMGEVWKVKDTRLDRTVALKVLSEEFFEDKERVARFEREAKLLAALSHPNIAAIYSFEEIPGVPGSSGRHVLVQELLEGETLRSALSGTKLARGAEPSQHRGDLLIRRNPRCPRILRAARPGAGAAGGRDAAVGVVGNEAVDEEGARVCATDHAGAVSGA